MKAWLIQPSIVKKLQALLLISVSLNIFFIINSMPKPKKAQQVQEETKAVHETSELEIKNFIKDYLNYFFSTGLVAQSFIEKHTQASLFESELKAQLELRTQKDLKSNFSVVDFYIEAQSQTSFQVILVGIESFENRDYQAREITMIINLEKEDESFRVQAIPKFEVKA